MNGTDRRPDRCQRVRLIDQYPTLYRVWVPLVTTITLVLTVVDLLKDWR